MPNPTTFPTTFHKTLVSAAFAFALAGPACAGIDTLPTIEEAHRAYYLGESERALLIYEKLAASGNAEAAERAGFILLRSPETGVRAGPVHVARATSWLVQAARAGRQGAAFVLGMMDSAD